MPPHCDTMDGPVVKAAARALEEKDVALVLPYVPKDGEGEVKRRFASVVELRGQGDQARELADLHFFETVVRLHRAGEGEPFTGLKPAGLDPGPVIPVAERARAQLRAVLELGERANGDIEANREYVSAMLGLQVWAHRLHECAESAPHEAAHHT